MQNQKPQVLQTEEQTQGPVEIDAHLLVHVGGGAPKSGWSVVDSDAPKSGWSETDGDSAPKGGW